MSDGDTEDGLAAYGVRVFGEDGEVEGALVLDTLVMLDSVDGEVGAIEARLRAEPGDEVEAGEKRAGLPHMSQLSSNPLGFCGVG